MRIPYEQRAHMEETNKQQKYSVCVNVICLWVLVFICNSEQRDCIVNISIIPTAGWKITLQNILKTNDIKTNSYQKLKKSSRNRCEFRLCASFIHYYLLRLFGSMRHNIYKLSQIWDFNTVYLLYQSKVCVCVHCSVQCSVYICILNFILCSTSKRFSNENFINDFTFNCPVANKHIDLQVITRVLHSINKYTTWLS